jgi:hypothetical protein
MASVELFSDLLFRVGEPVDRKIMSDFSDNIVVAVRLKISQMDLRGIGGKVGMRQAALLR